MALWGDIDIAAVTGTVTTDGTDTVVGSTGTFTDQFEVGEYLAFSDQAAVEYQVKEIVNGTTFKVYGTTSNGGAGLNATKTEKPTYDNTNVFGIDSTEAGDIGVQPGWVKVTQGTGGRAGRVQYETLVAFGDHTKPSESGSDQDTGDFGIITLGGTVDDEAVSAGAQATFAFDVAPTVTNSVTLTFQWQKLDAVTGGDFVDIAGATSASYQTPATASADNGDKFRVVVSGTGCTSVTSNEATLTVS